MIEEFVEAASVAILVGGDLSDKSDAGDDPCVACVTCVTFVTFVTFFASVSLCCADAFTRFPFDPGGSGFEKVLQLVEKALLLGTLLGRVLLPDFLEFAQDFFLS